MNRWLAAVYAERRNLKKRTALTVTIVPMTKSTGVLTPALRVVAGRSNRWRAPESLEIASVPETKISVHRTEKFEAIAWTLKQSIRPTAE
jgi:hypothetical protein